MQNTFKKLILLSGLLWLISIYTIVIILFSNISTSWKEYIINVLINLSFLFLVIECIFSLISLINEYKKELKNDYFFKTTEKL